MQDRRTLRTLLLDFCNSRIVEDESYSLVNPAHPAYILPHSSEYPQYLEILENLPDIQTPNVFGMHDNVTIGRDLLEGDYLISCLLSLQGCYSSGVEHSEGESQEESSSAKRSMDATLAEMITDLLQQVIPT